MSSVDESIGIKVPDGVRKSSSGLSFHVPSRPLVWPLNELGPMKRIDMTRFWPEVDFSCSATPPLNRTSTPVSAMLRVLIETSE